MGLFDGKVVVVTGSGGGIGRCHALAFAAEGAKVVVNDLGGTRDGSGQSHSMADQVVAEIKNAGGEAVANYASVADAEGARSIVQTAVDSFGRIDVLVNNAGILRDKSILKMDEAMWDLVIAVHLKGAFLLTKLAGERMKEQGGGGRIINTSSYAGLKGNFGQGNYGSAKAGIYGLTLVSSMEFAKFGVTVNAIAPMAKTRMTEDISQVPDDMKAEQISPMVLYLASDLAAGVTGRIFGIHGQQLFEYKMLMTEGVTKPGDGLWTPQEIGQKLEAIGADKKSAAAAVRETLASVVPAVPAAAQPSKLESVMMLIPTAFRPEKAAGWKATIQFEAGSEGTYTVMVENGVCRVEKGAKGTPTSKVKADPDTLLGLFDGSVDGQKAFMAGKLKIDKLGDMMNFQKAFDRSAMSAPAAAAAPAKTAVAASAAPVASAQDPIERAFSALVPAFRADKAAGWEANIHFIVAGAESYTVRVTGGSCAVQKGLIGKPTSAVKTDVETLVGLFNGTVDGQKAFMARKIVVDNIGDMMKFARAFDFKAAAAGVAPSPAAPPPPTPKFAAPLPSVSDQTAAGTAVQVPSAPPVPEGVNRDFLNRFFPGEVFIASAEEMKAYAEAVGDRNPAYLDEDRQGGIVGHPIFPVRYFHETMTPVVTDPELRMDLLRVVHGEQDMVFHRPLQAKDIVYPVVRIVGIEDKSSGQLVKAHSTLLCEGRPIAEAVTGIFIRGKKKDGGKKEEEARPARGTPTFTVSRTVDKDQPKRYAEASGDTNPIHLDDDVARAAGLPGVILHGLCTMAMATQAVVDSVAGADPQRLRRISVRFSKPVVPGATLETRIWVLESDGAKKVVEFETFDQEGRTVLTNGRAEISA